MTKPKTPFALSLSKGFTGRLFDRILRFLESDLSIGYACLLIAGAGMGTALAAFQHAISQ